MKEEKIDLFKRLAFGLKPRTSDNEAIWIHAVSVGEVLSLQNLVSELKKRHPEWDICFSALTPAGAAVAEIKLAGMASVFIIPIDFRRCVRKALESFRPKLLVLAESELWPNLLREAKKRGLEVLVINGRISERAFKNYRKLQPLTRKVLKNVDLFLMQTEQDKERLERLGVGSERLRVSGNIKSEVRLPLYAEDETAAFRKSLGIKTEENVVAAGSTHKGEEERLFRAFSKARQRSRNLRFILAPRHIERAGEIEKIGLALGFKIERRTNPHLEEDWDILILDTFGELARFYALSNAVFVGGSLVPWGGHNILEPAYYGKPIFFGPHMKNFAFLAESFLHAGGARIIQTDENLIDMFSLKDAAALQQMGSCAKRNLASLGGATDRTFRAIERFMAKETKADVKREWLGP